MYTSNLHQGTIIMATGNDFTLGVTKRSFIIYRQLSRLVLSQLVILTYGKTMRVGYLPTSWSLGIIS